jgi:Uncharacterized conserved protein
MVTEEEKDVYKILDMLGIGYKRYEHMPVYTVEEANKIDGCIEGTHCKNLFLRNRKGDVHYLIILEDWKTANLKDISEQINSTNLSFASKDRLFKFLKLTPGSVTPFGLINDSEKQVRVLLDSDLPNGKSISFHPNVNTATITISYGNFEKFLKWCGNDVSYINI